MQDERKITFNVFSLNCKLGLDLFTQLTYSVGIEMENLLTQVKRKFCLYRNYLLCASLNKIYVDKIVLSVKR